ncbi:aminoglycoside phosphotransferase family protein [Vibrio sp. ZSDE26]|uniref:Aminoglycoside phosphotransferase family protein n=1 Tax=Vibrio amylolyticus TaxID=2847292 RepID=A0A9X1XNA1_9VIBR|nr:aminoglycoside phosphotransferase family protein [Vibrio amylolyticus]MCK6265706.1 aminoglycoside phosphotransferase family protein [Vibrio amylolyticus]
MEMLEGGRENAVFLDGKNVVRPLNPWSSTIHRLLSHYQAEGLTETPRLVSTTNANEVLSYVEGDTYNYPLAGAIASQTALVSAAKLLRALHDASVSFIQRNDIHDFPWMLPIRVPSEVVCHGDFTPYNVALSGSEVTGAFDFDTAHPAPRVWDVAFSVYCWAPFKTDINDRLGTLDDQIERAKQFCDGYGLGTSDREKLVGVMIDRIQSLVDYMMEQAENGDVHIQKNIEDGHHLTYLKDIENLRSNKNAITYALKS